jgi:hypothetical protein
VSIAIGLIVIYFLIKNAVKNGIIEAYTKINLGRSVSKAMDYKSFLSDDNSIKSDAQKKFEQNVYALYSKRKLSINYSAPIEEQQEEIEKIISERFDKSI